MFIPGKAVTREYRWASSGRDRSVRRLFKKYHKGRQPQLDPNVRRRMVAKKFQDYLEWFDAFCVYRWSFIGGKSMKLNKAAVWESYRSDACKRLNDSFHHFVKGPMNPKLMNALLGHKVFSPSALVAGEDGAGTGPTADTLQDLHISWHELQDVEVLTSGAGDLGSQLVLHSVGINIALQPHVVQGLGPLLENNYQNFNYDKLLRIAQRSGTPENSTHTKALIDNLAKHKLTNPSLVANNKWLVFTGEQEEKPF